MTEDILMEEDRNIPPGGPVEERYLKIKEMRDHYRARCFSAWVSGNITPQQDIDGRNMELYCREYEDKNGLQRT